MIRLGELLNVFGTVMELTVMERDGSKLLAIYHIGRMARLGRSEVAHNESPSRKYEIVCISESINTRDEKFEFGLIKAPFPKGMLDAEVTYCHTRDYYDVIRDRHIDMALNMVVDVKAFKQMKMEGI